MTRNDIFRAAAEAAYGVGVALDRADGDSPLLWDELRTHDQTSHIAWAEAVITGLRQPSPDASHEVAKAATARAVAAALGFEVQGPTGARRILVAVARRFDVTLEQLRGAGRNKQHISHARHVGMFLCCRAGFSTPATGEMFGGRDHTTVISAREKIAAYLCTGDPRAVAVRALAASLEITLPEAEAGAATAGPGIAAALPCALAEAAA